MRSVRCDACGAKALIAASQCPTCGNLFEVRDGFGDLLPLAHCPSCDTFYPERVGSCRWCGTTPPPPAKHPHLWKHAGVAALVVLGVGFGSVAMHAARARMHHGARVATSPKPALQAIPVAEEIPAPPADTVASPPVIVARVDAVAPRVAPAPPAAITKPPVSARWITSIAKSWVIVRAAARQDARIVASVGPDSRVQLGEARGSWRRIRARGIAGWVDAPSSFAAPRSPTKTRGLAAR